MSSPKDMRKGFGLVLGTMAIVIVALFLIIFTGGPANATGGSHPITFCHVKSNPPQTLTTDQNGWENGHSRHGDYLGECIQPEPEPIIVPASLDHADFCGPEYALNAPLTDELVRWDVDTSALIDGAGEAVVTATALTDRPLQIAPGETAMTLTWRYSFTSEACETEPTPPVVVPPVDASVEPPQVVETPMEPTLPRTGTSELLPLIGIVGGLLLASGGLILRAVRRHV